MRGPTLVECHRVDQSSRLRRVLLSGAAVLALGAIVVALSFATRQPQKVRQIAAAVGFACTLIGVLMTIIRLQRALADDRYIAVRSDGLAVRQNRLEGESFFAWDRIECVRFDPEADAIVVELRDGEVFLTREPFGEGFAARPALARRLDGLRRKAEWNLLR